MVSSTWRCGRPPERAARQGEGTGRALIAESLRRAEEAGCCIVQLLSLRHRQGAHAFYRRLGFEPVAEGFRRYFDGFAPTTEHDSTGQLRLAR
jgi:ribosomal protein S18 acetylase RimI-like enzyme